MKIKIIAIVAICGSLLSWAVLGHHSLPGTYELGQHRTIQGTLAEIKIRNPHSFVTVDVTDDSGRTVKWSIEWAGTAGLTQTGVTSTTLNVGDAVIVTGAPSKSPDPVDRKLLMQRIVRPSDNWIWEGQAGSFISSTTPLPPVPNR